MGQAKNRKAEIDKLKSESPGADARVVSRGLNFEKVSQSAVTALARELHASFEKAKAQKNIDGPVKLLYAATDAGLRRVGDVPVACKSGCSHCCNIWVSVSAPEVLYISKMVQALGAQVVSKVHNAHQNTKQYTFETRDSHPYPCPLLDNDHCSIYVDRPRACRLAASTDADICRRSYNNITNEGIPTPVVFGNGRNALTFGLITALDRSALPSHTYEYNAALSRALNTPNAEQQWLSGVDIFAGVMTQKREAELQATLKDIAKLAFG